MSWLTLLMRFPANVNEISDIPEDFAPEIMGTKSELFSLLVQLDPMTDFSEIGVSEEPWTRVYTDNAITEVPIPNDPFDRLFLRNPHPTLVQALCERFGCRIWNTSSGEIVDADKLFRS
ncbi:MAG: hypothetical protein IT324_26685 [Anaerolineae bacterium]|nr:hypothetical protein [Anaerolineae bacterium]